MSKARRISAEPPRSFSFADVEALVEILAIVGSRDSATEQKLQMLLDRVAGLINAQSWGWAYSKLMPNEYRPTPIKWTTDRNFPMCLTAAYGARVMGHPPESVIQSQLTRTVQSYARALHELVGEEIWRQDAQLAEYLNKARISDSLHAMQQIRKEIDGTVHIVVGIFWRTAGLPLFGEREKKIAELIVQKALVYFVPHELQPSQDPWPQLPQRYRRLIPPLASRQSFEEIAEACELDVKSLRTYTSKIYKLIGVRDRGELVRMFSIFGGGWH